MKIIDHGRWEPYKPAKPYKAFEGAAVNVAYVQRDKDGKDWYTYIYDDKPFKTENVKMCLHTQDDLWIVGAAVYEPDRLFPHKAMVLEIEGYEGDDPQQAFGNKMFDPKTKEFKDRPIPVAQPTATETQILDVLNTIMKRLDKLEKRK